MTMASSKTIIISLSKYVADRNMGIPIKVESSGLTTGFDVKPTLANVTYDNINDDTNFSDVLFSSSKKRRLDHLSYEQKLQRKKLKNRVAAQCSRDRKKARLDELEIEVKLLKEMNDALLAHCDELTMKNEELEMKNKELTTENKHLCSKLSSRQTRDVGCSPIVGPAASIVHPPPQGLGLQPAQGLTLAVWRILTICLLFPTSWETLLQTITCPSWRNSQSLFFEKLLQAVRKEDGSLHKLLVEMLNQLKHPKCWGEHQKIWDPLQWLAIT